MKDRLICAFILISLFFSNAIAITCTKKHKVYGGETCKSIAKNGHVSLTNFYKWNPSLKKNNCASLHVGQYVCLSAPLATTTAKPATATTKSTAKPITATTKSTAKPVTATTKSTAKPITATAKSTAKPATATSKPTAKPKNNAKAAATATTKPTTTKPATVTTKKATKTTFTPSPTPTNVAGLTAVVLDEARFCVFLPSSPGNKNNYGGQIDPDAIADSEKDAKVFCTEANLTPGAQLMPQGFIKSAHYQFNTTAGFVQVTGDIDRTKYSLSKNDGGGQYDNHGAGSPPLSMCQGYRYYVSLIEPDIQGFCIRCCVNYQDCNASRSAYGCKRVVPPLDFSV